MKFISQFFIMLWYMVFGVSKKDLDVDKFGLNAFYNQPLGSLKEQSLDIRHTIGCKNVRILFYWDEIIQPNAHQNIYFSFIESILKSLEPDMKAIIVLAGLPSWVNESEAHSKFEWFCEQAVNKFKDQKQVIGFQIGNEPNSRFFVDNRTLQFVGAPQNYLMLFSRVATRIRDLAPDKLILSAATTSIVQNYPDALEYNKWLVKNGILNHCDVYCIHYYGDEKFINFFRPNGSYYFLKTIHKPIYCTEIGEGKFNDHSSYARTMIPFLSKKLPQIELFYWYQYDGGGQTESYGLKNAVTGAVSGLYYYMKSKHEEF